MIINRWSRPWTSALVAAIALCQAGCVAPSPGGASGTPAREIEVGSIGPIQGVGIAGRDIAAMTNQMARDLLASAQVMGGSSLPAPRIIIDSSHFEIQGSQPLNRDLISQRLLVELNRAAMGRIAFVGRRHVGMIEEERQFNSRDDSDVPAKQTDALAADFRLAGTFGTLDAFDGRSGMQQRYSQIVFELIDLKTSHVIWTGIYEVERAGADDIVYR